MPNGWRGNGGKDFREQIMNKLLSLACIVALLSACAGSGTSAGKNPAAMGAGAAEAAALGYHGPVHRSPGRQYDN